MGHSMLVLTLASTELHIVKWLWTACILDLLKPASLGRHLLIKSHLSYIHPRSSQSRIPALWCWLMYKTAADSAEPLLNSPFIQLQHDADGLAHTRPMSLRMNLILHMLDHSPVPA